MPTYRLVPEDEWQQALSAIETAAKALRQAGTVTFPGAALDRPATVSGVQGSVSPAITGETKGVAMARGIIKRVDGGGSRHTPKVFDRKGPKIADFVCALTNGSFKVPDIIDLVGRYVELKESRREAGGQIRAAVKPDKRFRRTEDGEYFKVLS